MTGEEALKQGLRDGSRTAIRQIYEQYHHRVVTWVIKNNGSEMEAEDLFQDALTVIYQKMQQPDFVIQYQFYTYLFTICRNLWLKRLRDSKPIRSATDDALQHVPDEPATEVDTLNLRQQIFRRKFAQLGKSCQEVLNWALKGLSPGEIAKKMSLKSERHASNRKSYCQQQLARMVKDDPLYQELTT